MLEKRYKYDNSVNRGRRVLKFPYDIFIIFSAKHKEKDTTMCNYNITSKLLNLKVIYKINDVTNVHFYSRLKQGDINISLQATL